MQRPAKPWTPVRFRLPPPEVSRSAVRQARAITSAIEGPHARAHVPREPNRVVRPAVPGYFTASSRNCWGHAIIPRVCSSRPCTSWHRNSDRMKTSRRTRSIMLGQAILFGLASAILGSSEGSLAVDLSPASRYDVTATGNECRRGFARTGTTCVEVKVPPNAKLNVHGNDFVCERGYERYGEVCRPLSIPPNARIDLPANDWRCNPGYRRSGSGCVPLRNPANAHVNALGNDWECDRGYRRSGSMCVAIHVPPNARLNSFGTNWQCRPGYRRLGSRCEKY